MLSNKPVGGGSRLSLASSSTLMKDMRCSEIRLSEVCGSTNRRPHCTYSPNLETLDTDFFYKEMTRDSSVGIVTGYGLDCRCSIRGRDKKFVASQCPDGLCPPGLLYNECCGPFPRGKEAETTHPPLVPRSRMVAPYLSSPISFHDVIN
jgi:hypothetical protein